VVAIGKAEFPRCYATANDRSDLYIFLLLQTPRLASRPGTASLLCLIITAHSVTGDMCVAILG